MYCTYIPHTTKGNSKSSLFKITKHSLFFKFLHKINQQCTMSLLAFRGGTFWNPGIYRTLHSSYRIAIEKERFISVALYFDEFRINVANLFKCSCISFHVSNSDDACEISVCEKSNRERGKQKKKK